MNTSEIVKTIFDTDGYSLNLVAVGGELLTRLTFENREDIFRFLPVFNELGKRAGFTDFVDCFTDEGGSAVHVAFKYHAEDNSGLERIIEQNPERIIKIFENILERLIVLNPPDFLTAVMLRNICVYEDGQIEFNYFLINPWEAEDGQRELAGIFYKMFWVYINQDNGLSIFYKRLQHGGFDDFFAVYEDFKSISESFKKYEPQKTIDLNTFKEWAAKILSLQPKSRKDYISVGNRFIYNKLFLVLLSIAAVAAFAAAKKLLGG